MIRSPRRATQILTSLQSLPRYKIHHMIEKPNLSDGDFRDGLVKCHNNISNLHVGAPCIKQYFLQGLTIICSIGWMVLKTKKTESHRKSGKQPKQNTSQNRKTWQNVIESYHYNWFFFLQKYKIFYSFKGNLL